MKTKSRQIRITSLENLYGLEFQEKISKKERGEISAESLYLIDGIYSNKEAIDDLIRTHSHNWKIERISLLDLNILRIAIYEMIFQDEKESTKIYIDEAIEIAKEYSSLESSKFINGILDSVNKAKDEKVSDDKKVSDDV